MKISKPATRIHACLGRLGTICHLHVYFGNTVFGGLERYLIWFSASLYLLAVQGPTIRFNIPKQCRPKLDIDKMNDLEWLMHVRSLKAHGTAGTVFAPYCNHHCCCVASPSKPIVDLNLEKISSIRFIIVQHAKETPTDLKSISMTPIKCASR